MSTKKPATKVERLEAEISEELARISMRIKDLNDSVNKMTSSESKKELASIKEDIAHVNSKVLSLEVEKAGSFYEAAKRLDYVSNDIKENKDTSLFELATKTVKFDCHALAKAFSVSADWASIAEDIRIRLIILKSGRLDGEYDLDGNEQIVADRILAEKAAHDSAVANNKNDKPEDPLSAKSMRDALSKIYIMFVGTKAVMNGVETTPSAFDADIAFIDQLMIQLSKVDVSNLDVIKERKFANLILYTLHCKIMGKRYRLRSPKFLSEQRKKIAAETTKGNDEEAVVGGIAPTEQAKAPAKGSRRAK